MSILPYDKDSYKLLHRGSIALAKVESNGICIDVDYLKKAKKDTEKKIQKYTNRMEKSDVAKVWKKTYKSKTNFNSNDQLGFVLFKKMGIDPPAKTKTGKYKTDETTLSSIDYPFVNSYLKIKKLQKALSTYLIGIEREIVNGKIHPSYNLQMVKTYRSSSNNPNFQNIPIRDPEIGNMVRRMFIASPGNNLVELDYGALEVCIAAAYHKDPNMIEYISNPKKDMHRDMAMECYCLSAKEVTKKTRFYGKNMFVFPQFYGSIYTECAANLWEAIGSFNLETDSGIPLKQHLEDKGIYELGTTNRKQETQPGTFSHHIKKIQEHFWTKRFPVYAKWKKDWYNKYMKNKYILTKTGFICQGFMTKNEVINYPVQGSAFHCLLWSLNELVQVELKKHKLKTKIVGQIHDSILADVPASELEDFLILANHVMTEKIKKTWSWINVPLSIEAEVCPVGGSWADKEEVEIPK